MKSHRRPRLSAMIGDGDLVLLRPYEKWNGKPPVEPIMWTWKHLAKAQPPLIENGKIIDRNLNKGLDQTRSTAEGYQKSFLIGKKPSIRVLTAGLKFAFGHAGQGFDYGWWNLIDALYRFKNIEVQFLDYATEMQQRGLAGLSDCLEDIVRKENFDVLFYSPYDLEKGILTESLKFITDHTDTQTVIWMDNHPDPINQEGGCRVSWANYIIATSPETARHYQTVAPDAKIIKSQWGFNPFTYPFNPVTRVRGITFCGSAKGNRSEILNKFNQRGLSVDVFGAGWSDDSFISFYELVKIFGQSKINLNLGDTPDPTTQPIKRRTFEVPGCRGFLLTTPAKGLEEFYEPGKELVIASSAEELMDRSKYYLTHEGERENIGQRGYERTLADHTWSRRLVDIFKEIGFKATPRELPYRPPVPFRPTGTSSPGGNFFPAETITRSINRETIGHNLTSLYPGLQPTSVYKIVYREHPSLHHGSL